MREGFEVTTAASGQQGIELAREIKPTLITLDVLMPGMDGWAVLQDSSGTTTSATFPS